ncbi:hypothetical protein EK21DRAFT_51457 [Setomelanomma holmii]|uniref:Uncharacterized protein n=1 Tax=Setomelanomma holmii TaxID=210430 RepID=A0A9P4LST3_9PLEO|nr:hypothetical protein EK21DRAFT_51457 [Setomelanomma holmii]
MAASTLLISLAIFSLAPRASSISIGNVDTSTTVGFVQEDNTRDTISLLLSCFATLGLCVYSAVHLNIPRKSEGFYRTLLRELFWCIIGLFAPELILYTAWRQLASARQLRYEVEQARNKSDKSTEHDKRTSSWTIAHGFYGTMGGFAIDIDHTETRYAPLFGNAERLTLTAKGVALLAQCGHIPDISLDDIKDKNKADGLAKLLVCIQAGWMIIQVITRTATGLPTTLLEVHTVAHVVCALIMYVLWWHKPRQVASPTILKGDWVWPFAAYMFLASRMSGEVPKGKLAMFRHATPQMKQLVYLDDDGTAALPHENIAHLTTSALGAKGHFRPRGEHFGNNPEPSSPMPEDEISAEHKRIAAEAVALYPALRARFVAIDQECSASRYHPYATELVQDHALDWPNAGFLRRTQSLVMGMVLWGASMTYGAIHVAAWDYFFPTQLEKLFWHLSSVWVTFCAAFWLLTNLLAKVFPGIDRVWVAYNERRLGWVSVSLITSLCVLCGVSYVVSRAFLVVEAFVSIREVPEDVYKTTAWSQVFPHL